VYLGPDDVLYEDSGVAIGAVVQTLPGLGLWMALARKRRYGSMNEVAEALPTKHAAIRTALEHCRVFWA
jgi:hypothetical protein